MGPPVHQSPQTESGKPLVDGSVKGMHSAAVRTAGVSSRELYRAAARSYDAELNPVLALEQRYLTLLLPPMDQLDVLDLGCGTGRWLAELATRSPQSLIGVDLSPEMLGQARQKTSSAAYLVLADSGTLPFPRASADLVLCSFLASYVTDLTTFVEQVRRVLRPGGIVFVTDLHPGTAARLGWRRGFHVAGSFVDVATYPRTIDELESAFQKFGMHVDAVIEPEFGEPELEVFTRAGQTEAFRAASGHPAIVILQLSLRRQRTGKARRTVGASGIEWLRGARVALGANESFRADVSIENGRIRSLGRGSECAAVRHSLGQGKRSVDLSSYLLLPGLVNAHDHLEFALFPRLGKGGYRNFVEWADDIHQAGASLVQEHRNIPKNTRLWWGGIRSLLAGVATVSHHNPYVAEVFDKGFAIRVLRDFEWAHSLQMGQEALAQQENRRADRPFIIHLAEGIDPQSSAEIFQLVEKRSLDERTVIVHGLGLDSRGLALMNSVGASLVWCPTSNVFLFGRTHDGDTIRRFSNVALGSDSPLTAQGDLLDEIRFAHESVGVPPQELYEMVTRRAARTLRLKSSEGTVSVGGLADLVGVRDTGLSPAQTLVTLSFRDIELVVIGGRVQLASSTIFARLPRFLTTGLQPLDVEGTLRWIRAPLARLFSDARRHLSGDIHLGGKRVCHGLPA